MSTFLFAQATALAAPKQPNGAELERAGERLSVVGNVLYVAAHPDDENTRLLAWLANEKMVRTAYLSLTRGEGGQNLIGPEQAPLLGVIRTQELLAARAIDGAEQLFTRARDFGFSKTPEETLTIWGKDEILADVVWAIRKFQPDVIITRFSPDQRDTHGHHTASAMLAVEAFHAAADPKFHPEQLDRVKVWQARRVVWNKGLFNSPPNEDLSGFLKMDVGAYNPTLGISYGEMAATSRSMHKSQGFGVAPQRGPALEYFHVLAGEPAKSSIFDGIDFSWRRVSGSEKVRGALSRVHIDGKNPAAAIPSLVQAERAIAEMPANVWKLEKLREVREVIAAAAGLYFEAFASDYVTVPGQTLKITEVAINRSNVPIRVTEPIDSLEKTGGTVDPAIALLPNQPVVSEREIPVRTTLDTSLPYWLRSPPEPGHFVVKDPSLIGLPEDPPHFVVDFIFTVDGRPIGVKRPVIYKWTDPVAGERQRPIELLPSVTVHPLAPLFMFPSGQSKTVEVSVRSQLGTISGELRAEVPTGWSVSPNVRPFSLHAKDEEQTVTFEVRPPAIGASGEIKFLLGQAPARDVVRIVYPHIPIQTLTPISSAKLVRFELKRSKTRIGYISGAGDEVPSALTQVGYQVTTLGDDVLEHGDLRHYEAIVTGVRAFNTNAKLALYHKRLMDYVAGGGTLLVQYNTNNRLSKVASEIGPYPMTISQDRVTDETAPIERIDPSHAIWHTPNPIGDADFAGWVQERGLYFAGTWDHHYAPAIATHDPSETPKQGALLIAHHGKGVFIYTGLAFFRQLPAGVPGAYRLFSNLLSYGR